jgi:hypothetical protein
MSAQQGEAEVRLGRSTASYISLSDLNPENPMGILK